MHPIEFIRRKSEGIDRFSSSDNLKAELFSQIINQTSFRVHSPMNLWFQHFG
jgi:hypothetical protein